MKKLVSIIALALVVLSTANSQTTSFFDSQLQIRVSFIDHTPVIEWESEKEINTSYYIIEKQVNNQFEIITTVKAGGSTYGWKQYQYEDVSADTAIPSNYRLTLVWMDGTRQSWTLNQDFTAVK